MDQVTLLQSVAMLAVLLAGFLAMGRWGASQALVLPVVAFAFLVLEGASAASTVGDSFREFAPVALVFTAIALPAHQLQRANLFRWTGIHVGRLVGMVGIHFPGLRVAVLVGSALAFTYVGAGLFHNITAIYVAVPIIISICSSFKVPSRWVLCGALVASNLGGFSTLWGDSPNLIESHTWGLSQLDFAREILPLNIFAVLTLTAVVTFLTRRGLRRQGVDPSLEETALRLSDFKAELHEFHLDWRLVWIGGSALAGFIVLQFVDRRLEVAAAAVAILLSVFGDRRGERLHTLKSLGGDLYLTLAAVFVIAHCISTSQLGHSLQHAITATGGAVWVIAVSSYLGTGLTEAASWASAAAGMVHAVNPSHSAAWALGGGICAGSSSILTAASAGIVLWTESRRFGGHAVTFRSYLVFGFVASLAMLGFYIAALTILAKMGIYS